MIHETNMASNSHDKNFSKTLTAVVFSSKKYSYLLILPYIILERESFFPCSGLSYLVTSHTTLVI